MKEGELALLVKSLIIALGRTEGGDWIANIPRYAFHAASELAVGDVTFAETLDGVEARLTVSRTEVIG